VAELNAGHRAWITPVVYWRCKDGKVFEIEATKGALNEETRLELNAVDVELRVRRELIARVRGFGPELQPAAAPFLAELQQIVDNLLQRRGQLLGETLRLRGAPAQPGENVQCRLTLRLRTPAQVGTVQVRVRYPADKVDFIGKVAGADVVSNPEVVDPVPGEFMMRLPNASQGVQWDPQEFELAMLTFQLHANVTDPIVDVELVDAEMQKNGAKTAIDALSAVLFIT
jgi:hypothetical protein